MENEPTRITLEDRSRLISAGIGRRREIGVGLALGGSGPSIARLVLGEAAVLVGAGLAAGLGASIVLRRLMEGQIFGVRPLEPVVIAGILLLVVAVAAAACAAPLCRVVREYRRDS